MNNSDYVRIFVGPSYDCTGNQRRRERSIAMAADGTTKRLYLHHQGEFQHNYYVIVSLHDGDHDGVVRISVDLSCVL